MMDSSLLKRSGLNLLPLLLALTACPGVLKANLLTVTPASVNLTCNTATGPASAVVVVKALAAPAANSPITLTLGTLTGGVTVVPVGGTQLTSLNNTAGLSYTVSMAAGCVGVTTGAPTFQFKDNGTLDATVTVNTTLVSSASGLSASPSPVTITCVATTVNNVTGYAPGSAQTVSVTSAATGGTSFTIDTVTHPAAAWVTYSSTSGGAASATAVTFTVVATAGCGGFAAGSTNTTTVHLLNAPAPDKLLTVSLQVVPPTTLSATPATPSLTYVKGSGAAGKVDVNITANPATGPFFSIDTSTLPIWLTVDSTTGTAPKSVRFSSTSVGDTLAPGTYTASVHVRVSGQGDLIVPVTLLLTNSAPKLTVAEGTTRNLTWTIGQALPTPVITAVSSDTPISYAVTTGGTLGPIIATSQTNGLAYSFGTPINVTFNPLVFGAATPNAVLTGTVTLTWGSPASTIVVTFNITVLSPGSTVTGLNPASIPTAASGSVFTVVLTGTGFVPSTDPTQKTKVGIVIANTLVADTNISANIVNPSNIILTITVPATADANLPFSTGGTGGPVALGVCNPVAGTCSIPTGTATLNIGSNPIIQAVTSSAALIQITAPTLPTVAPYDMVSIFGANFCSSGGTGCSTNQILYGSPDAVLQTYPIVLTPDAVSPTQRFLSVSFLQHGTNTVLGTAPLLFATNGQINVLVPGAVASKIGQTVDVVVNFGYGNLGSATMKSSSPSTVNIAATDPGLFTVGADGQGSSAALDNNYNLITAVNPGGMRAIASDSDTIQIYMTGLGVPDSTGDNTTAGSAFTWSSDCASPASYLSVFNANTGNSLATLDGLLINPTDLAANRLVPCLVTSSPDVPTVSIGGVQGTVTYAGWVASTVAGLYQINVKLPGSTAGSFTGILGQSISSITAPVQLPVTVTANSVVSQAGVTLWVQPRLLVAPPAAPGNAALIGTVGIVWTNSNNVVTATEGTSPYRYAVTSGLLPSGLTLNAGTGIISGTPAANTVGSYIVTVTATDSANVPVKGTVTFTLVIDGGLFMTSSGTAPYHATFGAANATLTTVTATSGIYPYAFTISSANPPTGLAVASATGVVSTTAATPAGTYHVTVSATDSTAGTPLGGSITFDLVEALEVSRTNPVAGAAGAASNVTTVSALGNTGTVTYALDATTAALGWVTLDPNSGIVAVTTDSVTGTHSVTVTATDGTAPTNAAAAGTGTVTFTLTVN